MLSSLRLPLLRSFYIIEKIEHSLAFFPFFFLGKVVHTAQHWPGTHCTKQGQEQDRRNTRCHF